VVARWTTIDALAPKLVSVSPYNFSFNNPLRFVDPDGFIPLEIFDEHDLSLRSMIYIYYTVNPAVAGFLSGALGISRQIILSETWRPGGNATAYGVDAMTLGHNVDYDPNYRSDNDIADWVSLVGHESTHGRDIENQGLLSFYSGYLSEYITNRISGESTDDAYSNIKTEQSAFGNEHLINDFFKSAKNTSDFMSILGNGKLSTEQKSNKLEALGLERITIPGLEKVSASLSDSLSGLSKDKDASAGLVKALGDIRTGINEAIEKDKKRAKELDQ
jgi:hypothetical protein